MYVKPLSLLPSVLRNVLTTTYYTNAQLSQAVLTVVFFLAAFFLHRYPGYILLFNIIFSYLWLVAVAFTASDFTHSDSALLHTVEAFSFIALYVLPGHFLYWCEEHANIVSHSFALLFNVIYDWHLGYRGTTTTTTRV